MDLCLYARNNGLPAEAGGRGGLEIEVVERVYEDIERKRRAAEYLRCATAARRELGRAPVDG